MWNRLRMNKRSDSSLNVYTNWMDYPTATFNKPATSATFLNNLRVFMQKDSPKVS